METKGPFHELANIVVNYAKGHKKPLNEAFFLAAMKAQVRVSSAEKVVEATHRTRRWVRGKKDSAEQNWLEIAHTIYSEKAHVEPDLDGEICRITVKGSWAESGGNASKGGSDKAVGYSYSYASREFAEPLVVSSPKDLVAQVLTIAAKTLGVVVEKEVQKPQAKPTVVRPRVEIAVLA